MYAGTVSRSYMILSTFHMSIGYNVNLLTTQHVHFDLDVLFNEIWLKYMTVLENMGL